MIPGLAVKQQMELIENRTREPESQQQDTEIAVINSVL